MLSGSGPRASASRAQSEKQSARASADLPRNFHSFHSVSSVSLGRLSTVNDFHDDDDDDGDRGGTPRSSAPSRLTESARVCCLSYPLRTLARLLTPCASVCDLCGLGSFISGLGDVGSGSDNPDEEGLLDRDRGAAGESGEHKGEAERPTTPQPAPRTHSGKDEHRRTYVPPRSQCSGSGSGTARPSRAASALSREGNEDDGTDNSDRYSSTTTTTTTEHSPSSSTVTLTRLGTQGRKERWVVQRGVLVCIGVDGIAREATSSEMNRLQQQQQHRHGRRGKGKGGIYMDGEGERRDGNGEAPNPPVHAHGQSRWRTEDQEQDNAEDDMFLDSARPMILARHGAGSAPLAGGHDPQQPLHGGSGPGNNAVDELESRRAPLHSLEQLLLSLDRCSAYLPVRVEVTAERGADGGGDGGYALHIIGPLQPTEHAAALGVLEDVLLEDCDEDRLRLTALHISDVSFTMREHSGGSAGGPIFPPPPPLRSGGGVSSGRSPPIAWPPLAAETAELGRHRASSNAFLDVLPSLNGDEEGTNGTGSGASAYHGKQQQQFWKAMRVSQAQLSPQVVKDCETRVLVFIKNVVENKADTIQSVYLTRCLLTPLDIGKTLPLPLVALRRLVFEQCPLTPAHVDALLLLARETNRRHQHRAASTRRYSPIATPGAAPLLAAHGALATANDARRSTSSTSALGNVAELQLCGALTEDAIAELLSYLHDEASLDGRPALQTLRVPSLLIRAARTHPFLETHPYVQVLPAR